MTLLISGSQSGLGKFLHQKLGGLGLSRSNSELLESYKSYSQPFDAIIHCAANTKRPVTSHTIYENYLDNIKLTEKLIRMPHKHFFYLSSVDIYPRSSKFLEESSVIDMDLTCQKGSTYPVMKGISESIVKQHANLPTILRCSALLGLFSRSRSMSQIIQGKPCELSLTNDSTFNYITYEDVKNSICYLISSKMSGTFNLASSENIRLDQVCRLFDSDATYGMYKYDVGNICTKKISALISCFKMTSQQKLAVFKKEIRYEKENGYLRC